MKWLWIVPGGFESERARSVAFEVQCSAMQL